MISVAVILTTYNRSDALSAVLEGYLAQDDRNFELIIAGDGSTEVLTSRILTKQLAVHTFSKRQWSHTRLQGVINLLSFFKPLRKLVPHRWKGVMKYNLSAGRKDLDRINGFDESYQGGGIEESDLTTRLITSGIRRKSARFVSPLLHLWHRQNPRTDLEENQQQLHELIYSRHNGATHCHLKIKNPKKVLVVATRRIGDVLLTTPLIRSLRRAWPEAQIDVLVFEKTEGFISTNPDINKILTIAKINRFLPHIKFLFSIRRRYDLALSLQTGDRPTLYSWIAGKFRIGMIEGSFRHWWWKRLLLNQWVPFDNVNTHTVLMNLQLTKLLEVKPSYEVSVFWRPEDEKRVALALPFNMQSEDYAILHVYPKFIRKRWRQDGWIELGQWLEKRGMRVVLTGGNEEEEVNYIEQIASCISSKVVNMAGGLSLSEVAFLTSRACLYVGVDTAPTHMAAALGVPTVAIFGPTNPVKWGPWPKGHTEGNPYVRKGSQIAGNVFLIQGVGDCVPCEKGCGNNRNNASECLQRLPASWVINAAQKVLSQKSFNAALTDGH